MSLRGGRGTRVLVLLLLYIGMFITIYQCFPKAVRWPYGFTLSPRFAARASSISSTRACTRVLRIKKKCRKGL